MRKKGLYKGMMVYSKEGIFKGLVRDWKTLPNRQTIVEVTTTSPRHDNDMHVVLSVKYPIRSLYPYTKMVIDINYKLQFFIDGPIDKDTCDECRVVIGKEYTNAMEAMRNMPTHPEDEDHSHPCRCCVTIKGIAEASK